MILALVGNQNCGKTTLFNVLTGSNQHVGNFPGVTVDQKSGLVRGIRDCTIVDLPGIYSLRPYTQEEIVTRDFILNNHPDGIVNILDATNLERNLYLTLQLIELNIPIVLALNMMDEVLGNGGSIDIPALSELLGVPIVPISAAKNDGISELTRVLTETVKSKVTPKVYDFCPAGPVHRCIHATTHMIEDHAEKVGISKRFAAMKLIEGDTYFTELLDLSENEKELLEHSIIEMEHDRELDRNAALADMRYAFIESVCSKTVKHCRESREHRRSVAIDKVLTNRFAAIPLFVGIMILIFYLSFNLIGQNLSDLLARAIDHFGALVNRGLIAYGLNEVVRSLIVDGIIKGVGSVLSFLPVIIVLFFFLSILEDTGYMARVAFVMDKLLRRIGLSGKSFVPMIIGFGCSVPAIMATRTLSSNRDRKMTILLTPFMSCSAKIPIYAVFAAAFFREHAALVMICLYFGGILVSILVAQLLKHTLFRGNPVPFVMELPNYRLPSMKSVLLLLWEKAKDFLERAFTVIFLATVIIWFLGAFDIRLNYVSDTSASILALLGQFLAPLFAPVGFGDYRVVTSLISGFTAKEAVVSTLGVLTGGGDLSSVLPTIFTTKSAISFLAFTLLYTPCVAAVGTIRRELDSLWQTLAVVLFQCLIAYFFAFLLFTGHIVTFLVAVLILWAAVYTVRSLRKGHHIGCSSSCDGCKWGRGFLSH